MVYILTSVFFFLFSLVLWNEEKNKREGRTHLYLLMAIFWLILHDGLRWEIGTDWEPYYNLFTTLDSGGHADFGYMIVLRLFRLLSNNYTLFLICFAAVTYLVLYKTIETYSCNPLMSVCIYYCSMLGLLGCNRHILAMFVCMYSLKYVFNKNIIAYLFLVLLAISIHKVAVFFLPVYFLYKKTFSVKLLMILLLLAFIIGNTGVMNNLPYLHYLELLDKLAAADGLDGYIGEYAEAGILGSLKRLLFVIPGIMIMKRVKSEEYNFFLLIYLIGCVLYLISVHSPLNFILGRAGIFFTIYEIIIIPYLFKYIKISEAVKIFVWLGIFYTYYYKMDREIHGFFMLNGVDIYNPYKCVLFI